MTVEEAVRALGVAIQADERFQKYMEVSKLAGEDQESLMLREKLQDLQEAFNVETQKETPDEAKIQQMQEQYQEMYQKLFQIPAVVAAMDQREVMDKMMNNVMQIIYLTMNGEDPLTCQPSEETMQAMQQGLMNM
ncbi:MAG: YlbF family regulator [Clostridia bacterium]|nr:YlbF family regulator [Clostridia bacterium]